MRRDPLEESLQGGRDSSAQDSATSGERVIMDVPIIPDLDREKRTILIDPESLDREKRTILIDPERYPDITSISIGASVVINGEEGIIKAITPEGRLRISLPPLEAARVVNKQPVSPDDELVPLDGWKVEPAPLRTPPSVTPSGTRAVSDEQGDRIYHNINLKRNGLPLGSCPIGSPVYVEDNLFFVDAVNEDGTIRVRRVLRTAAEIPVREETDLLERGTSEDSGCQIMEVAVPDKVTKHRVISVEEGPGRYGYTIEQLPIGITFEFEGGMVAVKAHTPDGKLVIEPVTVTIEKPTPTHLVGSQKQSDGFLAPWFGVFLGVVAVASAYIFLFPQQVRRAIRPSPQIQAVQVQDAEPVAQQPTLEDIYNRAVYEKDGKAVADSIFIKTREIVKSEGALNLNQILDIYDWMGKNIRYISVPEGSEPHDARITLLAQQGDCKNMAVLFAALATSIGARVEIVRTGKTGITNEGVVYGHAYTMVRVATPSQIAKDSDLKAIERKIADVITARYGKGFDPKRIQFYTDSEGLLLALDPTGAKGHVLWATDAPIIQTMKFGATDYDMKIPNPPSPPINVCAPSQVEKDICKFLAAQNEYQRGVCQAATSYVLFGGKGIVSDKRYNYFDVTEGIRCKTMRRITR